MELLRALYDWVLSWAATPYGPLVLLLFAFLEATFLFIPPDALLIALCLGAPERSFLFALICALGSVSGGMFGYTLGMFFKPTVVDPTVRFFHWQHTFDRARDLYHKYDAAAVAIAGFTPIPYWVFAISAGVARIRFHRFVVATALSRSARFFLVATLLFFFGEQMAPFIDKYFNPLALIFVLLIVAGALVVRFVIKPRRTPTVALDPEEEGSR